MKILTELGVGLVGLESVVGATATELAVGAAVTTGSGYEHVTYGQLLRFKRTQMNIAPTRVGSL